MHISYYVRKYFILRDICQFWELNLCLSLQALLWKHMKHLPPRRIVLLLPAHQPHNWCPFPTVQAQPPLNQLKTLWAPPIRMMSRCWTAGQGLQRRLRRDLRWQNHLGRCLISQMCVWMETQKWTQNFYRSVWTHCNLTTLKNPRTY